MGVHTVVSTIYKCDRCGSESTSSRDYERGAHAGAKGEKYWWCAACYTAFLRFAANQGTTQEVWLGYQGDGTALQGGSRLQVVFGDESTAQAWYSGLEPGSWDYRSITRHKVVSAGQTT